MLAQAKVPFTTQQRTLTAAMSAEIGSVLQDLATSVWRSLLTLPSRGELTREGGFWSRRRRTPLRPGPLAGERPREGGPCSEPSERASFGTSFAMIVISAPCGN